MSEDFQRTALEQMVQHDQALETYPFLSAQILNRWRRDGKVRFFKGREGKISYPREDLNDALNKELSCGETEDQRVFGNTKISGSEQSQAGTGSTDIGTMTEADALREKLWMRSISNPQKKNSSSSSVRQRRQAETQERSISSTS